MTTQRELGEMLIESEDTGRKMQARLLDYRTWCDHTKGTYFDVSVYEYRLEPKIVTHERWVVLSDHLGCATEEEAMAYGGKDTKVKKITWETEE